MLRDVIEYSLENHSKEHLYPMEQMYRRLKLKLMLNIY